MNIVQYNDTYRNEWQSFVLKFGNLYHDIRWRNIIENTYGLTSDYVMFFNNGILVGLLPQFRIRKHTMISLPYLSYSGILMDNSSNSKELLSELYYYENQHDITKIILRSKDDLAKIDANCYVTMIKYLEKDTETAFNAFHYKQRNMIRSAYKENYKLMVADIPTFYRLYLQATNSLGTPGHKIDLFKYISEYFEKETKINILLLKGEPIGTILEIDYHETRYDMWAFSFKKYLHYKPNVYLYWECLQNAINSNLKYYDFGRSIAFKGTYNFKKKWNAVSVKLSYDSIDVNSGQKINLRPRENEMISKTWSALPQYFTNFLGPVIRKYIY